MFQQAVFPPAVNNPTFPKDALRKCAVLMNCPHRQIFHPKSLRAVVSHHCFLLLSQHYPFGGFLLFSQLFCLCLVLGLLLKFIINVSQHSHKIISFFCWLFLAVHVPAFARPGIHPPTTHSSPWSETPELAHQLPRWAQISWLWWVTVWILLIYLLRLKL